MEEAQENKKMFKTTENENKVDKEVKGRETLHFEGKDMCFGFHRNN